MGRGIVSGNERKGLRGRLTHWWHRRRTHRAQLAHAVWDLQERYGAAAPIIARSSARQVVGFERRRFWMKVAEELSRDRSRTVSGP